jgi:CheY-like chemotaxis protein/phosphoribosyl 1,2-cyclic phosphodiesterase
MPTKPRVLIADDAPETTMLLSKALAHAGFETATAEDGEQALAMVDTFQPALVVADIMMPKLHGIDLLKRIKARPDGARIGVLMMSARAFEPDMNQARQLGAVGFMVKPVKGKDVIKAAEDFFAGKLATPEARAAARPTVPSGGGDIYLPALDSARGTLRLMGTRGSIAVPGATVTRHGGNTSCLEVRLGDDLVIIDAGTGIRELGLELAKSGPRRIHLFIGHTHWDHIQGFPFFAPAYIPGFEIFIYGSSGFGKPLEQIFHGQLDQDYFPVQMSAMAATMHFLALKDNPVEVGGIGVHWEYANHPGSTVGFRLDLSGKKIGYFTDNEFLRGYVGHPARAIDSPERLKPYEAMLRFLDGVDCLIHEAQYTNEEYLRKINWGHTSVSNACVLAKLTGAKRWYITHHEPTHDDNALDRQVSLVRQVLRTIDCPIEVSNAYDGMIIYL